MPLLTPTFEILSQERVHWLREVVATATEPAQTEALESRSYHFTFWYALAQEPRNAVEQVIAQYLSQHIPDTIRKRVTGAEWWLGRLSPPYAENFEFGLHQDLGENPETGELESPLMSSVFYLTTLEDAPLVVFDGPPVFKIGTSNFEYFFPVENAYVTFPGHLWHTILSRKQLMGDAPWPAPTTLRLSITVNWWEYRPGSSVAAPMELVAADYNGSLYPELLYRFTNESQS